jgi:kynurenine formamidase
MRTDWSKRWPDDAALADKDAAGVFHYPGWSKAALELLANLDQVPEAGGLVWVTTPKVEDGAGFPARVIAIVP